MKSAVTFQDQTLTVALFAMTSTQTRAIALYVREKYGIPALTACNIQIQTDSSRYLLSIPKHLLTDEELFLLKCATNSIFSNYLECREWSLSYTVTGWIYHKYKKFSVKIEKKKKRVDYKLWSEVMAGGIDADDPSMKLVEKTYFWCVLREQELTSRGWAWEAKKWNGFASCQFDDTKKAKELMKARKLENLPPLFFTLDVPEEDDAEDSEYQKDNSEQDEVEDDEDEDEESNEDEMESNGDESSSH